MTDVKKCIRAFYKGIQEYGWELKEYGYEDDKKAQYYILSRETDWFYVNLFVNEAGRNTYVNHMDDAVCVSYSTDNDELTLSVKELKVLTEFIEYVGGIECLKYLKEESDDQNRED